MPSSKANITGCNASTPLDCAIAPAANGNTAPPVPPNAVANPIPLTCKWLGDRNSRHDGVGNKPEYKLEGHGAGQEDGHDETKPKVRKVNSIGEDAKGCSTDRLSSLEGCSGDSRRILSGVADAEHE